MALIKLDLTLPNGERLAKAAAYINWLHANLPSLVATVSLLGNDDAAIKAEFGAPNVGDGTAINGLIYEFADKIDNISVADANRAYNGEVA
jgi:hypothetical protein